MKKSGGILIFILALAIVGPWPSPPDYVSTNFDPILKSPAISGGHLFGTDVLGRDLFVPTMLGIPVTFLVAIVATLVSLFIGVT